MQKFIVDGVGRSGTTALAEGLNHHPAIFCAVEQATYFADHRGLFEAPERLLKLKSFHSESNAKVLGDKDFARLIAFGNKYPGYFDRWDEVLDEIGGAPKAVVMVREPRGILSSWSQRVREGSFPAAMISAYAAFDIIEMINQATKSNAADRTLFVSFAALLTGDRCGHIFDQVVEFLGASINPAATAAFLKHEANTKYVAIKPKSPLSESEAALARTLPIEEFVAEVDRNGCILASQSCGQEAVRAAIAGSRAIMDQFEVCLNEHPNARGDLVNYVRRRSLVKDPITARIASASSSPIAADIRRAAGLRMPRHEQSAEKRDALSRLKKNLHWKKLLRWEKIFPR